MTRRERKIPNCPCCGKQPGIGKPAGGRSKGVFFNYLIECLTCQSVPDNNFGHSLNEAIDRWYEAIILYYKARLSEERT